MRDRALAGVRAGVIVVETAADAAAIVAEAATEVEEIEVEDRRHQTSEVFKTSEVFLFSE